MVGVDITAEGEIDLSFGWHFGFGLSELCAECCRQPLTESLSCQEVYLPVYKINREMVTSSSSNHKLHTYLVRGL